MDYGYHFAGDILVVEIGIDDGKLIDADISEFIESIMKLSKETSRKIAFDMSRKLYLNSSGLGELIKVKDNLSDHGIELILISPASRVESLLAMVGVDQFFQIISGEDSLA